MATLTTTISYGEPAGSMVATLGAPGPAGQAATVTVGSTATGDPGSDAIVVNSGTSSAAVLDFTIPRGDAGDQGPQGIPGTPGTPGAAATVAAGTTTTGAPGSDAAVVNVGTSSAAVFNFTIPRGDAGDQGPQGVPGVVSATSPLSYDSGTQNISIDLSSYLTTASAASTYQPLSGMSSYLTTASAAATYRALTNTTFGNVFISAAAQGYIYVNPNLAQSETTQGVVQAKGLLIRDASTNVPIARFEKDLVQIPPEGITFSDFTVQTSAGVSLSVLADYAQLAGATFTGKTNFTPVAGVAGLNVGIGGVTASSTTPGDLWIVAGGANLNFRDAVGNLKVVAALSNGNVFSAVQTIDVSSTSPALRVTQRGTGNVLVIEDSTTPDLSALVVDPFGNVGIGVSSAFSSTEKLEVVGNIKSTTLSTGAGPVFSVISTDTHSSGPAVLDLIINIAGVAYRIELRPA
jgi:hypothetical protein